jgi:hypothetical protein
LDSPFYFEGTAYWSQGDEDAHFEWLAKISCIRSVRGRLQRVYLDIDRQQLTQDQLRELEAVYRRYGGDLSQLHALRAAAHDDEIEDA